ncbi:hypothetical protein [Rhodococcus sp. NCIMB 12038]|uniref:hypothetical protein n=1 Tax=Rhodococcus sp. NCIMB 12038 TaxID=933800 RepID=UPI001C4FB2B2|nr:hypothetical protein [Rhodococcus sp. NCIMB 12038]
MVLVIVAASESIRLIRSTWRCGPAQFPQVHHHQRLAGVKADTQELAGDHAMGSGHAEIA